MSGLYHVTTVTCFTGIYFSSNDKKYTAGAWSPTRPSIIFLGTHEGNVEVWDLLEKTHEASVIQNISTGIVRILFPDIHFILLKFLYVGNAEQIQPESHSLHLGLYHRKRI